MKPALSDQKWTPRTVQRSRQPLFQQVGSMSTFKRLASVTLAVTTFPALQAEAHCPGNVSSLRLRLVQRSLIIAPVVINHNGPYDFLVDTGMRIVRRLSISARLFCRRFFYRSRVGNLARIALPIVMGLLSPMSAVLLRSQAALGVESTETLQANIRSAVQQNASSEQLGTLWLTLANRYQDRFELEKAEDAYARAIHLLRDTSSLSQYAESLHGMGNVYRTSGRLTEARNCLAKSLDIYRTLNDEGNMAHLHVALGLELLTEHKYREAETESTEALKYFESASKPDVSDMSDAYLIRSRAICGQGRCRSALDDVSQAHSVALNRFQENSIEMISIWTVQGQVQMQAGLQADGEQALNEALRLAQSRTDLPRPYFVTLQLTVLRAQRISLKAAHRKQEAKHVEDQIARIEADAPVACTGCTVSAPALMSPRMR
jgi:tetratricopeptide (TPR) repeat protein